MSNNKTELAALKNCPFCGNDELDITTMRPRALTWTDTDSVRCGEPRCPIENVTMTIAAWNCRYACPGKNGKKVYAGDKVKYTIGNSNILSGIVKSSSMGGAWVENKQGQRRPLSFCDNIELIESRRDG